MDSIYIGLNASTSVPGWSNQIAIGNNAMGSDNAVSIGVGAGPTGYATGSRSVYIGPQASGGASRGVAIGAGAAVSASGGISLGTYSSASAVGEMNIGSSNTSYGYNSSNYRLLSGVYDGQGLHDAATVAQGNTLATSAPTTATEGVLGQLYTDTTNMHTYQCTAIDTTVTPNEYTWTQRW